MPIWQGFCFTASHHLAHVAELTVSHFWIQKEHFWAHSDPFRAGWLREKLWAKKPKHPRNVYYFTHPNSRIDNHGFVSCMPIFGRAVKVFMCTLCTQVFAIHAHMAGLLLYSITSPSSCGRAYGESLLNSKRTFLSSLRSFPRFLAERLDLGQRPGWRIGRNCFIMDLVLAVPFNFGSCDKASHK